MAQFELKQLRQLLAIVEAGGFRAASDRLFITQPALSVSIRKLEEALGVELLVRGPGGVTLTLAGRSLLPQFKQTVAHADQSGREARLIASGRLGSIRIGFVGSAIYRLLPAVLPGFRLTYPTIDLELIEGTSATLLPKIHTGEIDIALVRRPLPDAGTLRVVDIETDRFVAVLPADHALATRSSLAVKELAPEAFVIFSRAYVPGLNTAIHAACAEAGFEPLVAQEVTQATTLIGLVGSGLGVALAPSVIAAIAGSKVVFVPLDEVPNQPPLILSMVTNAGPATPAVERFWSQIAER